MHKQIIVTLPIADLAKSNAFEDIDGHTWVLIHMNGTPPQA